MISKLWKVYGLDGHRQRESFNPSWTIRFKDADVSCFNCDVTGTNEFSVVYIVGDNEQVCWSHLNGQLSDGAFENARKGDVVEIDMNDSFNKTVVLNYMKIMDKLNLI